MTKKKKKTKKPPSKRGGRTQGKWLYTNPTALRQWRAAHKVSRPALAKALGVSTTSVQNWETQRVVPMRQLQSRLLDVMKGIGGPMAQSAQPENPVMSLARVASAERIVIAMLGAQAVSRSASAVADAVRTILAALREGG